MTTDKQKFLITVSVGAVGALLTTYILNPMIKKVLTK